MGPLGPSTLSVTPISCPSFALGGSAVMIARTAPCQNAVALTSWLARLGAALSLICHVPASALVMLATCRTSTGESWPLITDESVHWVPSGLMKLTWTPGLPRATLIAASLAIGGIVTCSVPVWTPPPTGIGDGALIPRQPASAYSWLTALSASDGLFTTW